MSKSSNTQTIMRGQFPGTRIIGLDILRISLALLVFMFHSHIHFSCYYYFLNPFVSVGAIAMTCFFLLSGYSLRLTYEKKELMEKKEMCRFYTKRLIGILPLYYTSALLYVIFIGKETIVQNLLLFPIEFLGIQSTFCSLSMDSHNGGTWFISCLIFGYLFYPFINYIVKHLYTRQKVILLMVLMFVDLWAVIVQTYYSTASTYDNPFYRLLEFSMGIIVADINLTGNGKFIKLFRSLKSLIIVTGFLIFAVSCAKYLARISDYMLLNWIALPCFVLSFFSLGKLNIPRLEKSRFLTYASKISYSFFLAQFFVWKCSKCFILLIGYDHNWVRILTSFLFTCTISILMYEIVQVRTVGFLKKSIAYRTW